MEAKQANIVVLRRKDVESRIDIFLKERRNENTNKSYKHDIEEFFKMFFNKSLNQLSWDDIYSVTYDVALEYRQRLESMSSYKNSTINNKMSGLSKLWQYFAKIDDNKINPFIFQLDKLSEHGTKSYGTLTQDEVKSLLEYCKTHGKQKQLQKYLIFKTYFITALRKNNVIELTWKDIKQVKDFKTGQSIWTINTLAKRNHNMCIPISDSFFNELIQLKTDTTLPTDKIFNLNKKTIDKILIDFCIEYNINKEERNITLHSIRSASSDMAYEVLSGDIFKVAKHMGHDDPKTTYQRYHGKQESLLLSASYMFNQEIDTSALKSLDKEELIQLISKSTSATKLDLLSKI